MREIYSVAWHLCLVFADQAQAKLSALGRNLNTGHRSNCKALHTLGLYIYTTKIKSFFFFCKCSICSIDAVLLLLACGCGICKRREYQAQGFQRWVANVALGIKMHFVFTSALPNPTWWLSGYAAAVLEAMCSIPCRHNHIPWTECIQKCSCA